MSTFGFNYGEQRKLMAYAALVCPLFSLALNATSKRHDEWHHWAWSQTKPTLGVHCYWRGLSRSGTKKAIIDRLARDTDNGGRRGVLRRINLNRRAYAFHLVVREVAFKIREYGDDGMGDKPEGMCRVEYWLAHIEPAWVCACLGDPDMASCPQNYLRWKTRWMRIIAATAIQSLARRYITEPKTLVQRG